MSLGMLAALVAGLAAFPHYSGVVAQAMVGKPAPRATLGPARLATVTFRVPDMDCPACAVSLSAKFQKLSGVADAKLDADSRKAVVTYDPAAQSVAALEKVFNDAGFHVASSEPRF
jgi:mercuric ion binding protein